MCYNNTSIATVSPIVGIGGSVASESTCVAELWVAKKVTSPVQEAQKTQHIDDNIKIFADEKFPAKRNLWQLCAPPGISL
jgi:hypothetical protein